MPEFDTVIKGGTVIDGLRTPRFTGDVGIKDGNVAYIGRISSHEGARVLDASGLIVAPGFVDLHTHYDSQVYWDPWCTISGWHGVTSAVIGNCGFGFAPVKPEDRDRAMLTMTRNEAVPLASMKAGMPWDWESYPEFLDSIDRTPKGINLLSYVGLNPLLMYVMGLEEAKNRPATDAERAEMCKLLEEAIEAGGCGLSTQLAGEDSNQRDYDGTPMATDTMSEDDLVALASVLGKVRKGFIQVSGARATSELVNRLAEASGRPIVYNALAALTDQHGVALPGYKETKAWIEDANKRGNRVFAQAITTAIAFEFQLEEWSLFDNVPSWREALFGTREEKIDNLNDPERRALFRAEYDAGKGPVTGAGTEDKGIISGSGIAELRVEIVEEPSLQQYEGFTIREIAEREGKHIVDAFLDIGVADKLRSTFGSPPARMDMKAMKEIANSPFALPGLSDGGAHTKFITMGAYPTEYIEVLVRENELMDLEEAHWRLSTYPAMAAGFKDRGWIKEGSPADIIVYDFEKLRRTETRRAYDFPANEWRLVREAEGYRWIMVNGKTTFEDGKCTGLTPGKLIRHGQG
ncbi:MAG: amidohydrolase family protein [Dehalococcoidia bacterium]|nr:amidohydrolase family protein [Dehalococcoidia bacterium]